MGSVGVRAVIVGSVSLGQFVSVGDKAVFLGAMDFRNMVSWMDLSSLEPWIGPVGNVAVSVNAFGVGKMVSLGLVSVRSTLLRLLSSAFRLFCLIGWRWSHPWFHCLDWFRFGQRCCVCF